MGRTKSLLLSRYKSIIRRQTTENLVRFAYAFDGVSLYLEPYLYAQEVAHIPFGEKIELKSLDYQLGFNYKWYKVDYQGITAYVSEKWIGAFPPPFKNEEIDLYAERLKKLGYDIDIETYNWEDKQEFKLLFPSKNMREIFNIATLLYPLDFKYPKLTNKAEEVLTKINTEEDIYEEFEITRNADGEVITIEYLADFGNSSDSVILKLGNDDQILLMFGSYCQKYQRQEGR